jgi:hypothetical protein
VVIAKAAWIDLARAAAIGYAANATVIDGRRQVERRVIDGWRFFYGRRREARRPQEHGS